MRRRRVEGTLQGRLAASRLGRRLLRLWTPRLQPRPAVLAGAGPLDPIQLTSSFPGSPASFPFQGQSPETGGPGSVHARTSAPEKGPTDAARPGLEHATDAAPPTGIGARVGWPRFSEFLRRRLPWWAAVGGRA